LTDGLQASEILLFRDDLPALLKRQQGIAGKKYADQEADGLITAIWSAAVYITVPGQKKLTGSVIKFHHSL
ncbi:MAG: hypothetical protein J5949_06190, partial [Oscillospiraceae bacterium]|nr:hypothetical protein [Oscillospiraceae bacterium]